MASPILTCRSTPEVAADVEQLSIDCDLNTSRLLHYLIAWGVERMKAGEPLPVEGGFIIPERDDGQTPR